MRIVDPTGEYDILYGLKISQKYLDKIDEAVHHRNSMPFSWSSTGIPSTSISCPSGFRNISRYFPVRCSLTAVPQENSRTS